MKNPIIWLLAFVVVMFSQCNPEECTCPDPKCPEIDIIETELLEPALGPLDEIRLKLISHPPNTGDAMIREQAIMMLDSYLSIETTRDSTSLFEFYAAMMQKVAEEIEVKVEDGLRIWMMYNHGFIIKTSSHTFAFDLIDGYYGWQSYRNYELPVTITNSIDVLLVSHEHKDHTDESLIQKVKQNGGEVITSSGQSAIHIDGLSINIYTGLHSVETRIFEVVTPEGYKNYSHR